ncbi:unnamed protein product [Chironomus riparius]|uniref:Luciferin 4-monooxygenase n=1 Tax=Chironomus riparius TaxID=315576 RepID=A0A9N9S1I0_9DIPT|nr:unnamed protein product [Chironomus riparius]
MANYDPIKRILSGKRMPQIYEKFASVGQVVLHVLHKNPQKIFQVNDDDGIELTGSQIANMMINIARNMYKTGLRSGDVAGLCASNTTYIAPVILACLLLRLPINPIDKFFDVNQIVNTFGKTKPKIVFCDHDNVGNVMVALETMRSDAFIVTLTSRIGRLINIYDLFVECRMENEGFIYELPTTIIPAYIVSTSGSTGNSKLTLVSHQQQLQLYVWVEDHHDNRFGFNPTSMFWLSGIIGVVHRTLNAQKRLVTSKPFTADLFFDLAEKYKINEASLYTPLLKLLIESPRFENANFRNFDLLVTGGVAVPETFRKIFQKKLINGKLVIAYGISETGGITTTSIGRSTNSTSIGVPLPNIEIKIQLDDGTTGFVGEIGEILVRHSIKSLGYFNNNPPAKFDDDGWLHSGDMGFIDDIYELNIVGQRTQAIRNIYNEVYPFEIESRVDTIHGVKRVVLVGLPDPIEMEIPTLLVVKNADSNINEATILEALSDLPHFQQPRGGIFFIDEMPLTRIGKIKRDEAKELAAKLKLERHSLAN